MRRKPRLRPRRHPSPRCEKPKRPAKAKPTALELVEQEVARAEARVTDQQKLADIGVTPPPARSPSRDLEDGRAAGEALFKSSASTTAIGGLEERDIASFAPRLAERVQVILEPVVHRPAPPTFGASPLSPTSTSMQAQRRPRRRQQRLEKRRNAERQRDRLGWRRRGEQHRDDQRRRRPRRRRQLARQFRHPQRQFHGRSGDDIANNSGTIYGDVDLGDGDNSFDNSGTLNGELRGRIGRR